MKNGVVIYKRRNRKKIKVESRHLKEINSIKIIIRKQKYFPVLFIYLIIIFNLNILIALKNTEKYKNIKLYSLNEITIKIRGGGTQNILNENYPNTPTEIIVNEYNFLLESKNKVSGLNEGDNIIIMKWDYKIDLCEDMFYSLTNLIEVDLSNFDASELTSMDFMFQGCTHLTSINLNNLYTPKLNTMRMTFYECSSLLSLDLSSLDTSLVTKMSGMFSGCISLKTICFGTNFKTSNEEHFSFLFYSCTSLESIDLSKFDTTSVTTMSNMFANCTSLTSLDLSNFRTNSIEFAPQMFEGCTNLKYLDISNFNTSKVTLMINLFKNCKNLEYIKLNNFVEGNDIEIDDIFDRVPDNITYCTNNMENIPKIMEELNNNNCTINDCSDDWNTKTKKSIDDKKICVYNCSEDDTYFHQYKNKCYNNCPEGTILSSDNTKCLVVCPENFPFEKDEECFVDCNARDFFNKLCIINKKNVEVKEKMVDIIENSIKDESLNILIENVLNNGDDLILKDINETFQITTSINQNNKVYNNGETTINLGECENLLKKEIGLTDDETLIIYKIDYFLNNLLIPITEYEIFNPRTKDKLDLNICNEKKINIDIPVKIDENNLNKYNPFSEYYKEKCYPYSSECGDDNILIERQKEFNNNNLSLCESNCIYKEYDSITKKVKCECEIKTKFSNLSEILNNKNDLLYHITNIDSYINISTSINTDLKTYANREINTDLNSNTNVNIDINSDIKTYINILINQILNDFKPGILNTLNYSSIFGKDEDLIIQEENITYQITSSNIKNKNNNISSIYLKDLENKLKKHYNINNNSALLIFKIDYKIPELFIPIVEYKIFRMDTKEPLYLDEFNENPIYISYPVLKDIDNNIFVHDPNSEYYNDKCFPFTTKNGTDIISNDRKKEYNDKNLGLCENNCKFLGYNRDTKISNCECQVKKFFKDFRNITINKSKLLNNFIDFKSTMNLDIVFCVKLLFTLDGLKNNIGSYLLFGIIMISLIVCILFYAKEFKVIFPK